MSMGNGSMCQTGSGMVPQFAVRANRGHLGLFPESFTQDQVEWDIVEFVYCVKGGKFVLPPRTAGTTKKNQLSEFHEWVAKKHGVSQQCKELNYDSPTSRKSVFKTALHCAANNLKKNGILRADLPYDAWELTAEGLRLGAEAFGPQQSEKELAEVPTSSDVQAAVQVPMSRDVFLTKYDIVQAELSDS